jgi:hypothetical protein
MSLIPHPLHILSALHNGIPMWVLPRPVGVELLQRSKFYGPTRHMHQIDAQTQVSEQNVQTSTNLMKESATSISPHHHRSLRCQDCLCAVLSLLKYSSRVHSLKSGSSKTYWGISALILAAIISLAGRRFCGLITRNDGW